MYSDVTDFEVYRNADGDIELPAKSAPAVLRAKESQLPALPAGYHWDVSWAGYLWEYTVNIRDTATTAHLVMKHSNAPAGVWFRLVTAPLMVLRLRQILWTNARK